MPETETQHAIERHNRRELWRDVTNHLRVAEQSIGQALSALEDIGYGSVGVAPLLEALPTLSARIERFRRVADEEVTEL